MYKKVTPTPKELKEQARRTKGLESMTYIYDVLMKLNLSGLTLLDHAAMLWLYMHYSGNIKVLHQELGMSLFGSYTLVHRLMDKGYIKRVNAYSVILTSKGVIYIESFV